ncbi:uncharacterized protein LOC111361802 [Spodoptera litura]|uniref:Uncharacterized protein LOC111361802 n=1 Tax=Spodoptera litura TaxID=69820 RepID=A0A9J7J1V1_SPOLT|nr:uncharacterized protein LOC111361802 [Spodoptera litura]
MTLPATKLNMTLPTKKIKKGSKKRGSNNTALRYDEESRGPDSHICQPRCPDIYSPVCIVLNNENGKYYKVLYFVNHCEADRYLCDFWADFPVPSSEDAADIKYSNLDWTFCGTQEYMRFVIFSQNLSSMDHYGWLKGSQKYNRILKSHERGSG